MRFRFLTLFGRSCRLRCPVCGEGKLFHGPFAMHESCAACGTKYRREQGFFLGAVYFNYGLTALIAALAYPLLTFNEIAEPNSVLIGTLLFVVVFPLWFFRYARSLWLGFDEYFDPRPTETKVGK